MDDDMQITFERFDMTGFVLTEGETRICYYIDGAEVTRENFGAWLDQQDAETQARMRPDFDRVGSIALRQ